MDYKEIFKTAYKYMDESLIEGNCGDLCGNHCCRNVKENDEDMGIYLLPEEYETVLINTDFVKGIEIEKHTTEEYYISKKVGFLNYMVCGVEKGCIRELRPIQCRTYPFEPYLVGEELFLVIEKEQDHDCPLINQRHLWRDSFVIGIYKGWKELLKIDSIKEHIRYDSEVKKSKEEFLLKLSEEEILNNVALLHYGTK